MFYLLSKLISFYDLTLSLLSEGCVKSEFEFHQGSSYTYDLNTVVFSPIIVLLLIVL